MQFNKDGPGFASSKLPMTSAGALTIRHYDDQIRTQTQIKIVENHTESFRLATAEDSAPEELLATPSNKHFLHRHEEIHHPDKRAFLKDPHWPRNDFHANLTNFTDRGITPNTQMRRMDDKTLKAEAKAVELTKKMALINEFEEDYGSKLPC